MTYAHQKLRKHYYKVYDIPFCQCGGTWHYDSEVKTCVCDECGGQVPIIKLGRWRCMYNAYL